MNPGRRIIGAVVLVSLAVIFIPMLLEEPHETLGSLEVHQVPERSSEVPRFTIKEPSVPKLAGLDDPGTKAARGSSPAATSSRQAPLPDPADSEAVSEEDSTIRTGFAREAPNAAADAEQKPEVVPLPSSTETQAEVDEPPLPDFSTDAGQRPVAWAIQIGTFRNRESAERIRKELVGEGTGGYIQTYHPESGETLLRVFAGPFLERSQAEKRKQKLDKRYSVDSMVVRYRPHD